MLRMARHAALGVLGETPSHLGRHVRTGVHDLRCDLSSTEQSEVYVHRRASSTSLLKWMILTGWIQPALSRKREIGLVTVGDFSRASGIEL